MAEEPRPEDDEDESPQPQGRADNLAKKKPFREKLIKLFEDVERGFQDQDQRHNEVLDWWDIYNCRLGSKQFYNGTSQIYVPLVHNAVNARVTRFVNQIFPQSGRYVEVTTEDGTIPHALMALAEHYVRKAKLRTVVCPALMRNGDVEGQYNLYVSWRKEERHVAMRVSKPVEAEGIPIPDEEAEDIHEEVLKQGYPEVEVLADSDVCILPATADDPDEAIACGGSVSIIRRWSKPKIRQLMREGAIDKKSGEALLEAMSKKAESGIPNIDKEKAWAAGIKTDGGKHALIYEVWSTQEVDGDHRLTQAFYGGEDKVLGCRLNPLWCDRLPVISAPVRKVSGAVKGLSPISFCADMQYSANDAINMGNDATMFALVPIIMTDPEKNPRSETMVLAPSAIWQTSPKDTQFAQFPKLWTDALEVVAAATQQIATTLSVSPAAITQQTQKKKLNQAEIANEQQIDILSTADAVTVIEDSLLTPLLVLFMEMDHQYRDKAITVRQYGELGVRAAMQEIPPIQMENRWQFRWFGVEAARNAQAIQQQVGAVNILRGIPPQMYAGYSLDLVPVITQLVENTFGPRLAPLVFKDMKSQLSMEPEFENGMLSQGFDLPVHPMDDDAKHLQAHMQAMQMGDPSGNIRTHILRHQQSMQMKVQASMQQKQAQQGQRPPGGGGQPRMGASPGGPRPNGQGPPGSIHQDRMADPRRAPQ